MNIDLSINTDLVRDILTRFIRSEITDRKSTRLNSSHLVISYAVFCLKKKKNMVQWHRSELLDCHIESEAPHDLPHQYRPHSVQQHTPAFCGHTYPHIHAAFSPGVCRA